MNHFDFRTTHKRFVYQSFDIEESEHEVVFRYHFLLEPGIAFTPETRIPLVRPADTRALIPYVFNLGMVEAISYWKAACPTEFVIEAGPLSDTQVRFWHDLMIHGLGEFFYRNDINFTTPNFLTIRSVSTTYICSTGRQNNTNDKIYQHVNTITHPVRDLVLIGGGKDSAAALGILGAANKDVQTLVVNPTHAALENIRVAGYTNPIQVDREIDPTLITLNAKGYFNGHTPFSAYLAFLGTTVAVLNGFENVIVSNERSANEGNVVYRGMEINHQYSKSFRFEQMMREYAAEYFEDNVTNYFSLMRPLNDVQIGSIFATHPEFFDTFRSCNVGSKAGSWCGACAKCAFTYLTLSPFIAHDSMIRIFGREYFNDARILEFIKELVGLTPVKPFECVGTRDESRLAVLLSIESYASASREIPEGLLLIKSDINASAAERSRLERTVLEEWGDMYNLSSEYVALLKDAWKTRARLGRHT